MPELSHTVIIVSAGSGTRMGASIPKQYMLVNRKPVLVWTMQKFMIFDPDIRIVIVIGKDHDKYFNSIFNEYVVNNDDWSRREIVVTTGGDSRFESVRKGLEMVNPEGLVGIHDAVRPMVSPETIARCFETAAEKGSAIPVIEVEDSIRVLDGTSNNRIERERLKRVQTPQVFKADRIKAAYNFSTGGTFTDDASVYEKKFGNVTLVEGNYENIKITKPFDLQIAGLLLG